MPIHNLGYRAWPWRRTSSSFRWLAIAQNGFRIALKSNWVKRLMFFAWLPILYWGAGIFVYERFVEQPVGSGAINFQVNDQPQRRPPRRRPPDFQDMLEQARRQTGADVSEEMQSRVLADFLRSRFSFLPMSGNLSDRIAEGGRSAWRVTFWTWLLMTFFRYPQATTVVFMLGFIAPSLVARDVRSRAFLLYFSRPIGRIDYMLGKLVIPAVFLAAVTTLPALVLYLIGLVFSPDISAVLSTWDIPLRIVLASISLILPTASLAVMLSSMTQESRFAAFAWFAVWALGYGAYLAVIITRAATGRMDMGDAMNDPAVIQWAPISLYNCLGQVQTWIFGFDSFANTWPCLLTLGLITVVSLVLFFRNISKSVHA
ncbi:MAG: ABC transporter permease subunit [Planctomycetota bacterium]|jgi:ABC-2 type transport system permease protein|nr:ABC transporter permease [Blastopirellula sp.]